MSDPTSHSTPNTSGPVNRQWQRPSRTSQSTNNSSLTGGIAALDGFIFDCGRPEHASAFVTTDEEIQHFIRLTFPHGHQVVQCIKSGTFKPPDKPNPPENADDIVGQKVFERLKVGYVRQCAGIKNELRTAYSTYLGQCTPKMTRNLEALTDFKTSHAAADIFWLRQAIESTVYESASLSDIISQAVLSFYLFRQNRQMTDSDYFTKFMAYRDKVYEVGGRLGAHPKLIQQNIERVKAMPQDELSTRLHQAGTTQDAPKAAAKIKQDDTALHSTPATSMLRPTEAYAGLLAPASKDTTAMIIELALHMAEEQYCAALFVKRADQNRHGQFLAHLKNSYSMNQNFWPQTTIEAYRRMINWRPVVLSRK